MNIYEIMLLPLFAVVMLILPVVYILKKKKRRDEDEIDRTFQTWKADSVF